jgi:hypothetical protein
MVQLVQNQADILQAAVVAVLFNRVLEEDQVAQAAAVKARIVILETLLSPETSTLEAAVVEVVPVCQSMMVVLVVQVSSLSVIHTYNK